MKTKPAHSIVTGDKINRFGHLHPVVAVATVIHPLTKSPVIEIAHDLGKVCFMPDAMVEVG